ncbi:MAG: hypothetical protein AB1645_03965 [Bacillota bacterium]
MEKLMKIDRRIIYIIGVCVVVFTMLYPIGLPVKISDLAKQTYAAVENLPDGSLVIISPMYDAGAMGELHPMFTVFFYHAAKRGYKIVVVNTSWVQGPQLVHPIAEEIAKEFGLVYGEDWINLGSKPGGSVFLQAAVTDLWGAALTDYTNRPIASFPIMNRVPKITAEFVNACLVLDCGTPGAPTWLTYVNEPENIPLIVGEIQMSVPENMPYVASGQYKGMIAGSRGCAEYELLVGRPGKAIKAQDTMSSIALLITLFIVLGNIGYLTTKKK